MKVLATRVAVGPLGDADQADVVQPEIGHHLARHGELAGAAVDQHQVGPIGKHVVVVDVVR